MTKQSIMRDRKDSSFYIGCELPYCKIDDIIVSTLRRKEE